MLIAKVPSTPMKWSAFAFDPNDYGRLEGGQIT